MKAGLGLSSRCLRLTLTGLLALIAPLTAQATTLISFTDVNPNVASADLIWSGDVPGAGIVRATTWTQSVPAFNVSISAIVENTLGDPALTGTAFLMHTIGPGTTVADSVVPSVTFNAPQLTASQEFDLSTAPYTTLFSGISLAPGTYYLVIVGSPLIPDYEWLGDVNPTVQTAPGFTTGTDLRSCNLINGVVNSGVACGLLIDQSFFPASDFGYKLDPSDAVFYRVEGTVESVPEPASATLLLTGAALGFWRRDRRSKLMN